VANLGALIAMTSIEVSGMDAACKERPWTKIYPDWMPHDLSPSPRTALDLFSASAKRRPDNPAVYYFDLAISYREIDILSNSLAEAFIDLGLRKGDRVIVALQNIPQFLVAQYAVWKSGAIVVPLNPMVREKELVYHIRDSEAKILVILQEILCALSPASFKDTSVASIVTTSPLDMFSSSMDPPPLLKGVKKDTAGGALDMMALLAQHSGKDIPDPGLSQNDVACVTYASGIAGQARASKNTHANVVFSARVYKASLLMDENDVILGVTPLFHVSGQVAHLSLAALTGVPIILFYKFDPGETLRLIERWRATMTVASSSVFISLMDHPDIKRYDISSLRKAYSDSAPSQPAILNRFEALTNLYVYNVYGLTETTSPSHITPLGKRMPVDDASGVVSVGLPVPNGSAKIVDLDQGVSELGPGEIGEIVVKGPMAAPDYWKRPDQTRRAMRDGWLYTGDVGKMDQDGWFYVLERKHNHSLAV
jgi:long-chain acyl-CoA synthetase